MNLWLDAFAHVFTDVTVALVVVVGMFIVWVAVSGLVAGRRDARLAREARVAHHPSNVVLRPRIYDWQRDDETTGEIL